MQKIDVKELLNKLPDLDLNKDIPYSILNSLYTRVSQKELAHSEILASFLNPAESHQHGFLFLEQFLKDIGLKDEAKNLTHFKNINVYTERRIKVSDDSNSRPIDILIIWEYEEGKNAIIIENKLNYAIDAPVQLKDYYNGIKREGYEVKKVVYMHIDQHIKKNKGDVGTEVVNYNAQKLIKSLQNCNINNSHSHITEYVNLLINNVQNYMYMETALEIQKILINDEVAFKNLVAVSNIVNSTEWHVAKFDNILSDIEKDFVKDELIIGGVNKATGFNAYYKSLYFKDQKYWLDIWSSDNHIKLFLCCGSEDKNEMESTFENIQFDSNWGSWQYYNIKDNCVNFPSDLVENFKILVKENLNKLYSLKKTLTT